MGAEVETKLNPKDGLNTIRSDLTFVFKLGLLDCLIPLLDSYEKDGINEEELSALMRLIENKVNKLHQEYTRRVDYLEVITKDINIFKGKLNEETSVMKKNDFRMSDRISTPTLRTPVRDEE